MTRPQGRLTSGQKAKLIEHSTKNPDMKAESLAKWAQATFKLIVAPHRTTIGDTLRDATRYTLIQPQEASLKKARIVKYEVIETSIINWVLQMQHRRISVSGDMIKAEERDFARLLGVEEELKFSNGWLEKFQKRNGFRRWYIHGESGDAQMEGNEEKEIKTKIAQYELEKVYNMDETGLFYKLAPDTTIAQRQIEGRYKC
jgi:Tc5 transposase DNA-binding domain